MNNSMDNGDRRAQRLKNGIKTGLEASWNFTKAAAIPIALGYLGINAMDLSSSMLHEIYNNLSQGPVPFFTGMGIGIIKNIVSIDKTLKNLDGKTKHGTKMPLEISNDRSEVTAQITCVDARRENDTGGAIPGSFAVLGSELTSLIMAGLIGKITPDSNPIAEAIVGYNVGANLVTEGRSIIGLISQIRGIVQQAKIQTGNPDVRVKILMEDHWDGCGAQGFTSILSYLSKFKWHNLLLADIIGLPNEILGYMFVNSLSPMVGLLSGGKVSLSASLIHSPMSKAH